MRNTTVRQLAVLALFAVAPLTAQRGDPTMAVVGSGKLPADWMMKIDAQRGGAVPAPTAVSLEAANGGLHVKSGPAAVYYNTKEVGGTGQYSIEAKFTQTKSMEHEAFGLFIAGHNMQDSSQNYVYFVMKPSDGSILIAHRTSWAGKTTAIVPETPATPEAAINRDTPTGTTNTMLIHVAKDSVHFAINGKVVKALSKAELGIASASDGQTGLRINHNMDMQITDWKFKKY